MRVGLNLVWMGEGAGGVGRYATELGAALVERCELHVFAGRDTPRPDWAAGVRSWTTVPLRSPLELAALPALGLARRLDVLHSPANVGPPRVPGLPSVVTLHDLIWWHEAEDWGTPEAVRTMHRLVPRSVRWATRVLADSEHAAADIATTLGVPRAKIDVAPLAVAAPGPGGALPVGVPSAGALLLCVAQLRPYKQQEVLVRAAAGRDVTVVLPGAVTPYGERLRALADEVGARVVFPGYVSDAELEALYARATAVVLPSRYEGFGLPVLEAMARGVPVACSDRTALGEVAGDAALRFDPADQAAVDAAVGRLLDDAALREDLARRGRARAAEFTWERTAELTLAAYRRAARVP